MDIQRFKVSRPYLLLIQYKIIQTPDWTSSRYHYQYIHLAGLVLVDVSSQPDLTWRICYTTARAGFQFEFWNDRTSRPTDRQLAIHAGKFIQACILNATRP